MKVFMKKKILLGLILIIIAGIIIYFTQRDNVNYEDSKLDVVLSLEDKITDNSAWCGTFNLIWNDLKNDLAKQDIIFNPQLEIVENLNKETFTTDYLNSDSYYKVYGNPSLELKKEIEDAIKKKFNETSDILDEFDFTNRNENDYFLYAMLKKDFKFNKEFTELTGNFKNNKDVKFFGIDDSTNDEVRTQVEVLYYNNENDFAIKLLTEEDDEVIISMGSDKLTFKEIYEDIIEKNKTNSNILFGRNDVLKVPNIEFKVKKQLTDLENKDFYFKDGRSYHIQKALQTIEFELDKSGGRVKSEAGIDLKYNGISGEENSRKFIVDDTFAVFLKEKNKELPYFASKISNILDVQ